MCSHVFRKLSLMWFSGLKRVLNRWTESGERESVPQGALTTLRTAVCVDRVPLSFQEIIFYGSDQSHSFLFLRNHPHKHIYMLTVIFKHMHANRHLPPLIILQSADSRII